MAPKVNNLNEYFGNDVNGGNNFSANNVGNFGENNYSANDIGNFGGENFTNNTGDFGGENFATNNSFVASLNGAKTSVISKIKNSFGGSFSPKKILIILLIIVVIIALLYAIYHFFFKKDECKYTTRVMDPDSKSWKCPSGTIDTQRDWGDDADGEKQCAYTQQCIDALGPVPKRCIYSVRIPINGEWKCPAGTTDTGRSWEHIDGEKQCQTPGCPPPGTPVLKPGESACTYTVRVANNGKWSCPDGTFDTKRSWEHVDGSKQCASSQKCVDSLGPIKLAQPDIPCSPLQKKDSSGNCVCDDSKGVVTKDGACVCQDGFTWDGMTCVQNVCPPNQILVNGKCQCKPGFVLDSKGVCVCAPGYKPDGFGCSLIPVIPSPKPPNPAPKPVPTPAPQGTLTVIGTVTKVEGDKVYIIYTDPANNKRYPQLIRKNHGFSINERVNVVITNLPPYKFITANKLNGPPAPGPAPKPAPGPSPKPVPKPAPKPAPVPSGSGSCDGNGGEPFGDDQQPFFYICEPGRTSPTKMPCATGTLWNPAVNVCDWPKK